MDNLNRLHFGTDGVRGKFPEVLSPAFAYALGSSIGEVLGTQNRFLIGRDTRSSGPILSANLGAGLEKVGATFVDIGILPTPAIAYFSKKYSLPAIVITASHNPAQDNGIKVFKASGEKILKSDEEKIEQKLDSLLQTGLVADQSQTTTNQSQYINEYLQYLYSATNRANLDGLNVVLDCANGAAFHVGVEAFRLAQAKVFPINTESDGVRINENCGATSLADLQRAVVSYGADIGFAFDGDADRVMVVDNKGNVRDGDYILSLFALDMQRTGLLNKDKVVATIMSNGALNQYLSKHDIDIVEVNVGDKYVLEELVNNLYSLGGEQSGHIIRTDKALWGDGILNALLISEIAQQKISNKDKTDIFEIFDMFEPFVQLHEKVIVPNKQKAQNNKAIETEIDNQLMLLGKDNSRIIIRPSGTEEIVRITVESSDKKLVEKSIEQLSQVVIQECR